MSARRDGGLACGKPTFVFASVSSPKLRFVARVRCFLCERQIRVPLGEEMATFRIGNELVGIACDHCLDEASRKKLADRRARRRTRIPDLRTRKVA